MIRLPAKLGWSSPVLAVFVGVLLVGSTLLLLPDAAPRLDTRLDATPATVTEKPAANLALARGDVVRLVPTAAAIARSRLGGDGPAILDAPGPLAAVAGTLRDSSNAPIRGTGVVEFVDSIGRRRVCDAGPEGAYALQDLAAGPHWVTARASGYRSVQEQVELRPDVPVVRKDFTLPPVVELRIVVTTPEGGVLPGANWLVPVATLEPPEPRLAVVGHAERFGVGCFLVDPPATELPPAGSSPPPPGTEPPPPPGGKPLPPGSLGILQLDCDLPVHVSLVHHDVVLQTQRIDSGQDVVTFTLSPADVHPGLATIRALVVDAGTRQPMAGARMVLQGGARSDPGVATDASGVAVIERHQPGRFDLHVLAKGFARYREAVDVRPGATIDLGTIELPQEVAVAGRVLGTAGQPLAARFELGIVDPADQSIRWLPHEPWQSGGDGTFLLRGLDRGSYVIRTDNHDATAHGDWQGVPWVSGNVLVDLRRGPIADLEVRLHPAVRLVLHAVGAVSGLHFRVVDERGLVVVADRLTSPAPRPLHLPAGSYRIDLLGTRGALLSQCRTTLAAATVHVDLVRPPVR